VEKIGVLLNRGKRLHQWYSNKGDKARWFFPEKALSLWIDKPQFGVIAGEWNW